MKKLLILILLPLQIFATNYYVKSGGNDALDGLTDATAWGTVTKVNSFFPSLVAGDSVLFKRGDTWYGRFNVTKSGSSGNPIVIGTYGAGADPIFTGFSVVSGFTNMGGNIYESSALSNTNIPNIVTIGGDIKTMGRFPNTGYNYYSAYDANTYITDAALSGLTLTGGTVCIRKVHDILSNDPITSQSGGQIFYTNLTGYNSQSGYGYFVQNVLSLCDVQNEWYFNNTTKKLSIYSTTSPTNVQISTIDTIVYVAGYDYITFDNIHITGANVAGIAGGGPSVGQSIGVTTQNCEISYSGRNGIYISNTDSWVMNINNIHHSQNNAIYGENEGGRCVNAIVTNNIIKNIGIWQGMSYVNASTSQNISNNGVTIIGENFLIQYNIFDSLGHCAVAGYYSNDKVKNNLISNYCMYYGDAGGINFFDISGGANTETGVEVSGNILINGESMDYLGVSDGTNGVMGIYFDDKMNNVYTYDNYIFGGTRHGIYGHNVTGMVVRNNVIYDSWEASYSIRHDDHAYGIAQINNVFVSNICYQLAPTYGSGINKRPREYIYLSNAIDGKNIDSMFIKLDSNIYARPLRSAPDTTFRTVGTTTQVKTFATWKSTFASTPMGGAWDINSVEKGPSAAEVIYKYNATSSVVVVDLGLFNWIGMKNENYPGTITLQPWTAAILTKGTAIAPPDVSGSSTSGINSLTKWY